MPAKPVHIMGVSIFVASSTVTQAEDYLDGNVYSVNCYQNGQLIFETKERTREFKPTSAMVLMAEVSAGQVQETTSRLYASVQSGLVCVLTNKK